MSEVKVKVNEIAEKVIVTVCSELNKKREGLTLESDLADLGADSLNLTDIVLDIEDTYGFEMPENDMQKVKTIGDLVRYTEVHAAK